MTADDRHGVQCGVCHRLVDPVADAENPPEDAADPRRARRSRCPRFGGAMMVIDPLDRLRGPFDIVADLGSDPHVPDAHDAGLAVPRQRRALRHLPQPAQPAVQQERHDRRVGARPRSTPPTPIRRTGFPEQSTFDEWAASAYATTGVYAPQFGGNKTVVSTCQDCHMPDVTGQATRTSA